MERLVLALALGSALLVAAGAALAQAPRSAEPSVAIKGIVFVPLPADVVPGGIAAPASAIDASRVPALNDPIAETAVQPYLGLAISEPLLGSLRTAVMKYYAKIGRPFVTVTIPKQDVTDGVVQVVVVEARLGKIGVEGDKWFDAGQYQNAIRAPSGEPIDSARLSADTDWLNQNQYRHVVIVAQPGVEFGTTDLVVRAQDRLPLSVNAGFDDTGTKSTSLYRLSTGFDWGNAFWRGDDLNYEFTTAPDPRTLAEHSLAYTLNLPWHDSLSVSGSYATTQSIASGISNTDGVTGTASLRYNRLLPTLWGIQQTLSLGYDFKTTNNDILFGGVSVFPSTSEIDQFLGIYSGQLADPLGSTGLTLTLVGSPGGLTSLNNNAAFQAQQAGATANYLYGRLSISRLTNLPAGFDWSSKAAAQLSDASLLPSEQLILGGYQSIRGFVEQGATRDEGAIWQNELRLPAFETGLAKALHLDPSTDALVPFWFFDIGGGRNHQELAGVRTSWITLAGTGPGLTWNMSRNLSFRFTWGIPLLRVGTFVPLLGPQFSLQMTF